MTLVPAHSPQVLDYYGRPRNVGSFPEDEPNVVTAVVGSGSDGEMIRLQLQLEEHRIVASRFKAFGCTTLIAAASWAADHVVGLEVAMARELTTEAVITALVLPANKQRVAAMAIEALRLALDAAEQTLRLNVEVR